MSAELAAAGPADEAFTVTLTAERPALWTWIELDGGDTRLSDNFFHLRPDDPISAHLAPAGAMPAAELAQRMRVASIVDTYR